MSIRSREPLTVLRRYFIQGLVVIVPLSITAFVLTWLFRTVDGLLGPWLGPALGWSAPGIGIVVLMAFVLGIGMLVERTVGGRMVRFGERFLERVPLVRPVYRGSSRIVRTVLGDNKMAFREVVLFEHPGPGLWAIGFVTGDAPSMAADVLTDEGLTIYLPTAPNPMSGYLIILDRSRVRSTSITVEEAFTYVLSAGTVSAEAAAVKPVGTP